MIRLSGVVLICILSLGLSSPSFAREGCNRHCLEKLLSQIQTLKENIKSAVPVGTLLPYSGDVVPEGYLLCDGSILGKSLYPKLNVFLD